MPKQPIIISFASRNHTHEPGEQIGDNRRGYADENKLAECSHPNAVGNKLDAEHKEQMEDICSIGLCRAPFQKWRR